MKLAIIANPSKYQVKENFVHALKWAMQNETQVYFCDELYTELQCEFTDSGQVVGSNEKAIEIADVVLVLGGDGTILSAAKTALRFQKPILGVNSGRLGFMANTQQEQLTSALSSIKAGEYTLDKRHLLTATDMNGKEYVALNEFLFTRRDSSSMITVSAEYDGNPINQYWADGLIVATPTGSTAYNLSSGGPIIMPSTEVLVVTPINPHSLTTRPLILPTNKKLKVTIDQQETETLFSYDGHVKEINTLPFSVEIERSGFTIDLIQLPGQNYFETLRNKLLWGLDRRRKP